MPVSIKAPAAGLIIGMETNMGGAMTLDLEPVAAATPEPNDYVRSIFEREMGVTLHNLKAGSPRDEAMRNLTKEAASLYAKRVLRELIQNAFDGAAGAEESRIMLRLDLRSGPNGTLYVANSGYEERSKRVLRSRLAGHEGRPARGVPRGRA
jgi:hypothetical protein